MTIYNKIETGKKYTESYKVFITEDNKVVSPFHNIKLHPSETKEVVRVVNEIPRFENAKFEINKSASLNCITQDTKKGEMRFVSNVYPFKGYLWNYGALPQTWEDKDEVCEYTKCKGDNDPLDVVDIGTRRKGVGEVYEAKVLGCLALIDDGECDWKIVVIDTKDRNASSINDIEDVEKFFPGLLADTFKWFKVYKLPDGKPENIFGLNSEIQNKDFALEIIDNAHKSWKKLITHKHIKGITFDEPIDVNILDEKTEEGEVPLKVNEYFFLKKD
ncbi:Inorganic pyrophosphatase [Nosema granulosis]|uniref:inorganic diphosphatase n=1 Tax=Nosema granulosis TaxID=83296 RepID=A0A9P6L079_9MICR|nr:Inorganic pyrophosphatase [Nosema granulosis]